MSILLQYHFVYQIWGGGGGGGGRFKNVYELLNLKAVKI